MLAYTRQAFIIQQCLHRKFSERKNRIPNNLLKGQYIVELAHKLNTRDVRDELIIYDYNFLQRVLIIQNISVKQNNKGGVQDLIILYIFVMMQFFAG